MSPEAYWWFEWAVANGTPVFMVIVIVIWMRKLWRQQADRAEVIVSATRENIDLLRQATAHLEEIRDILKAKP